MTLFTRPFGLGLTALAVCASAHAAPAEPVDADSATEPFGKLAAQAYTFRRMTFLETLDTVASIGIRYVEAYPGQTIGGDLPGKTHHSMPDDVRARLKAALKDAGVELVAYGVVKGKDEDEWRSIFAFAKDMGIESITTEPGTEQMDLLASLCEETGIGIAIHNHAKPSKYWDPNTVLSVCGDRTKRIGACGDTGHWTRSGLDPLACLRQLEGRIVSLHLKDLNELGNRGAFDVPWGTGVCDMDAMLTELRRQGFNGVISIEYEKDDDLLADHVGMCVRYLENWNGPACYVDDLPAVLANVSPGPDGVWTDADLERLAVVKANRSSSKPKNKKTPAPGPQADITGYKDTTDDGKGTITASGEGFPNEGPGNVFDNTFAKWCNNSTSIWITYKYEKDTRQTVTAYTITSANDNAKRDPKDWELLGSNDGETWTVLDTRKDETFGHRYEKRLFTVETPGTYCCYQLKVASNHGDVSSQLSGLELLVKE